MTKTNNSQTKTITTIAKPFTTEPRGRYSFRVEDDVVRVFDPLAGYYTRYYSLSPREERRIRRLATEEDE